MQTIEHVTKKNSGIFEGGKIALALSHNDSGENAQRYVFCYQRWQIWLRTLAGRPFCTEKASY